MPSSGKLFTYRKPLDLKQVMGKLAGIHETQEAEGFELIYEYQALSLEEDINELYGIHTKDILHGFAYHSEAITAPETIISPFRFFTQDNEQYLFIFQGKSLSNKVALDISGVINDDVYEARLNIAKLRRWVEAQKKTILSFFEDLDLVNADKSALYAGEGGNVTQTDLWGMYLQSGEPGYLMAKTNDDFTVGLGKDGGGHVV